MTTDPLIGRVIAGHRVEALIGRGGMGVVYRVRHERLRKVRALKLLPPELAHDRAFRERFEREWRMAAAIEHPNIVEVLDAGETDEHLYILMRLIEGADLSKLVAQEGPLEAGRTLVIIEQVASALDAAHGQGLVHRDVSPRNVLVEPADRAYLADFGVAKTTATRGLTQRGYFVGNLDYAAPEQIASGEIDGRVDVYALGGVVYTCLTGHPPYERESEVQLMYAHLNDAPPVPSARHSGAPEQVDPVVARAMAKAREDRYGSCGEVTEALRDALGGIAALPARATTGKRAVTEGPRRGKWMRLPPRRTAILLAALLLGAGGATAGALVAMGSTSSPPGAVRNLRVCTPAHFRSGRCTQDDRRRSLVASRFLCSAEVTSRRSALLKYQMVYEGRPIPLGQTALPKGSTTWWFQQDNGVNLPLPGGKWGCELSLGTATASLSFRSGGPVGDVVDAAACATADTAQHPQNLKGGVCARDESKAPLRATGVRCSGVYPNATGRRGGVEIDFGNQTIASPQAFVIGGPVWSAWNSADAAGAGTYTCKFLLDDRLVKQKSFQVAGA